MASLLDYAHLSNSVYGADNPGGMHVAGWSILETGLGGAGFKGAVFHRAGEMVVSFAGTDFKAPTSIKRIQDSFQDLTADARFLLDMPRQVSKAHDLYIRGVEAAERWSATTISICGHSLGGGLAQCVAYWTKANFVTFNAPGVYHSIQATRFSIIQSPQKAMRTWEATFAGSATGFNYRLPDDPISLGGVHYGSATITMENSYGKSGHSMNDVVHVCERSAWGSRRPFG